MKKIVSVLLSMSLVLMPMVVMAESEDNVDELKSQITTLESENAELKEQVAQLESELEALMMPETEPSTEIIGLEYSDPAVVRLVQETLNGKGYDSGTPDGKAGEKTANAIKAYQTDNKINVNGVITDELLESLGIADKIEEAAKTEAAKAEYSSDYSYEAISRNPDQYIGKKAKYTGKILQVQEEDNIGAIRLATDGGYDNVIFVIFDKSILSSRLLEDDYVTVYGTLGDIYTYQAVMGNSISIPSMIADMIELS